MSIYLENFLNGGPIIPRRKNKLKNKIVQLEDVKNITKRIRGVKKIWPKNDKKEEVSITLAILGEY